MPVSRDALIAAYIQAKDGNRPHLLRRAFVQDAQLEMVVNTGAISFPPAARCRDDIAEMLVRQFGAKYENIYTFCLDRPAPDDRAGDFSCRWTVGMTEKSSGAVRVGWGGYEWRFSQTGPLRVAFLRIVIEAMAVLPDACAEPVLDWLSGLPYPWCDAETFVGGAPDIDALRPVIAGIQARPTGQVG